MCRSLALGAFIGGLSVLGNAIVAGILTPEDPSNIEEDFSLLIFVILFVPLGTFFGTVIGAVVGKRCAHMQEASRPRSNLPLFVICGAALGNGLILFGAWTQSPLPMRSEARVAAASCLFELLGALAGIALGSFFTPASRRAGEEKDKTILDPLN